MAREVMLDDQAAADEAVVNLMLALIQAIREGRASVVPGTDIGIGMRDGPDGSYHTGSGKLSVTVTRGPNWVEGHPFGEIVDSFGEAD